MACTHMQPVYRDWSKPSYDSIIGFRPCGRCVSCIVDKRSRYEDEARYELRLARDCGSYVTFTFDKYHLTYVRKPDGSIAATCNYKDFRDFLKRIRSYMDRYHIDNAAAHRNFKYFAACEYGSSNDELPRPHWHACFFGLNDKFFESIFRKCWRYGEIKVLPIKPGAVRYIASYISKQVTVFGQKPQDIYECKNLSRPKVFHSRNFGLKLYTDNWQDILDNDLTYLGRHNRRIPIPMSIKKRFHVYNDNIDLKKSKDKYISYYGASPKVWNLKTHNDFLHVLALQREVSLTQMLSMKGEPVPSFYFSEPLLTRTRGHTTASTQKMLREVVKDCLATGVASGMREYWNLTESIHKNGWCYDGQSKFFPAYKSYHDVIADVEKNGDYIPF